MKVECHKCKKTIDLEKDFYISLGTHQGKAIIDKIYFHFNCWRQYFEEKTREKAENITNTMQERMKPIAEGVIKKIVDKSLLTYQKKNLK